MGTFEAYREVNLRAITAESRVKELEADFAKLTEMAKDSEALRSNALTVAEQWQVRATRLQQELDEAYERAAKVAGHPDRLREWPHVEGAVCRGGAANVQIAIVTAIRQLASGPDKEKPESPPAGTEG